MLYNLDPAYVAGIVDGEGCISIFRSRKQAKSGRYQWLTHQLVLTVANLDINLLNSLREAYGGGLHGVRYPDPHQWSVTGEAAEEVIRLIKPWLIVKAEQAKLALEFQEAGRGRSYGYKRPPELTEFREDMWIRMKEQNQRLRGQLRKAS